MHLPRFSWLGAATTACLLFLSPAAVTYALPDLRPQVFDVAEVVENVPFAQVAEGCAGGTTNRRLVRFGLLTYNDGPDTWNLGAHGCPDCAVNPGAACTNPLFVCGTGHARALVASFARPELVDQGGNVVAQGYKPGFCLVDSVCGSPQFTNCDPMGISAGCADRYDSDFACMYVDFTDDALPPGDYILRLASDPENRVAEADENNNVVETPVTIGPPPEPCGNSSLDAGETCDDGGTTEGDGCDATCQVEACHTCSGEPSTCVLDSRCARCRRAVSKETAKLAQVRAKILTSCELGKLKGRHDDPCPDSAGTGPGRRAADELAKAVSKFEAKIARTCGGDDRTCGGNLTGEVPPWLMQFPAACPGMLAGGDPLCTQTINDCSDLATCLECLQRTAVDRTIALTFADLIPTDPRLERVLNRCQRTIGTESQRLFAKGVAERAKCWDARRKGKHGDDCPDAFASTVSAASKAARRILNAELRHGQKLGKACGGRCDVAREDFDPQSEIGFPATCYDVTIPGGASCAGVVTTLQELVDCTACVAAYHAACVNVALVPEYMSYPAECVPAEP